MGEVIVITSGKGGVGKTITTANIGISLASMGKRVVLVDGDAGLRNLDIIMGLENRIVYTLIDVIRNKCLLKQALIRDKKYDNLFLLPTTEIKNNNDIKTEQMIDLISELKHNFDYVLIDCPSGIEQGFENAVVGASRAIVVVNPEITSVRDADRVIGKLEEKGFYDIKIIINRFNNVMAKNGYMLDISEIIDNLNVEIIGVVPYDKTLTSSTNKLEYFALNKKSNSVKAFKEIGLRIIGREIPFENYEDKYSGFGDLFKKLFLQKQSLDYYE
jgi:septum site-determining protein MinD